MRKKLRIKKEMIRGEIMFYPQYSHFWWFGVWAYYTYNCYCTEEEAREFLKLEEPEYNYIEIIKL